MKIPTYKLILLALVAAAMALTGVLSATRLLEQQAAAAMAQSIPTVVIDAGHGGEDGGAVSVSGVLESQLNLEIALRVESFLALTGFETVMVRESDTAVYDPSASTISEKKVSDLRNRVQLVNQTPGALLLSIHQNLFSEGKYAGAQVFYAKTDGSRDLAERTQQNLIDTVDPKNHRQAKPAETVYLMNHIQCTGVLVECGFLSNEAEDLKLQDAGYQKKLTLAMGCSLAQWVEGASERSEV
ncbi:MAG: N-acetylmuramoyl-L-alanine amidase [Oscillospiraceae bacterium]|nr:N-acetylmuramoyl-L-alanine amidase [Oscillospiraceae bacterium]